MTHAAFQTQVFNTGVPRLAACQPETIVSASAAITTTYLTSSVIQVTGARQLVLLVDFGTSLTADDEVSLLPAWSYETIAPLATADVWYYDAVPDGVVTAAEPGGTIFTSGDVTLAPEWAKIVLRKSDIRLEKANNAGDIYRDRIVLDCLGANYFFVAFANKRADSGTITIKAVRLT